MNLHIQDTKIEYRPQDSIGCMGSFSVAEAELLKKLTEKYKIKMEVFKKIQGITDDWEPVSLVAPENQVYVYMSDTKNMDVFWKEYFLEREKLISKLEKDWKHYSKSSNHQVRGRGNYSHLDAKSW